LRQLKPGCRKEGGLKRVSRRGFREDVIAKRVVLVP